MFVKNGRGTEREILHCRVTYSYQSRGSKYFTDGVTRDLCRTGCGIRGSIIPSVGSQTSLRVYLPGHKLPIALDAKIAWVAGDYFGVRFAEMNSKDYTRVRRYLWTVLNTTM
jgi:hypothetical protein